MADLEALAATVRTKGWALGSGDIESVRKRAALLGWVEVAPRRGDATVSALRPAAANTAHPKSLSAVYGLGQQPLHTDGAHMQEPPDVLVFISTRPSATPTRLWPPESGVRRRRPSNTTSALSHGMFLVRGGRDSFYAPALSRSGYRYDAGCMTPCDARAREVQEYFEQELSRASTHEWSAAGQVLVVNNRRALHARSALADGDLERELTRIAFQTGPPR
jgi:Taurine catabolism dioxygenase TauD, TfdA family